MKKTSRVEVNREIEALLQQGSARFSATQLELLRAYSGYGGIKGTDIEDSRILYEYYTPEPLIEKMWAMAYAHSKRDFTRMLEPACGIGKFFVYAPPTCELVGFDISPVATQIASILYPSTLTRQVTIRHAPFEAMFFRGNTPNAKEVMAEIKSGKQPGFDLIIGNPPYGKFEGRYAGMGEKKATGAESYDEYFITRGLDILLPGGLLVLVIGAALENGGTLFLDRPISKVKLEILRKGKLLDAYRLPQKVFTDTDVSTEIVVFEKLK